MPPIFSIPPNLTATDPYYRAATGPVWRCMGREILGDSDIDGHAFLLRRLPLGQSMLRISPILAQISRVDHPNLWGPSYWKKDGSAVWVASQMHRGERLEIDPDANPRSDTRRDGNEYRSRWI